MEDLSTACTLTTLEMLPNLSTYLFGNNCPPQIICLFRTCSYLLSQLPVGCSGDSIFLDLMIFPGQL